MTICYTQGLVLGVTRYVEYQTLHVTPASLRKETH